MLAAAELLTLALLLLSGTAANDPVTPAELRNLTKCCHWSERRECEGDPVKDLVVLSDVRVHSNHASAARCPADQSPSPRHHASVVLQSRCRQPSSSLPEQVQTLGCLARARQSSLWKFCKIHHF